MHLIVRAHLYSLNTPEMPRYNSSATPLSPALISNGDWTAGKLNLGPGMKMPRSNLRMRWWFCAETGDACKGHAHGKLTVVV